MAGLDFIDSGPFIARLAFLPALRNTPAVQMMVTQITEKLMASYAKVGGINHLDGKNLPSKNAISSITVDLLFLLFPGFFNEQPIHSSELKVETATLLDSVFGRLEDEVYKSLLHSVCARSGTADPRKCAHQITADFLARLPEVRELLQTDAEAAFQGDPAAINKEEVIVSYPFIEAIAVQRMAHLLYTDGVAFIPRMMTEWAHSRSGMDIHPGAVIGSHFFVDHCTGTVIGETCIIGKNVKMYHGVTLGARSTSGGQELRGQKRHPTIEDDVTIYPGATILGGETVIGAGSTIGGNVFLMSSVVANSLVINEDINVKIMSKKDRRAGTVDFQI
ncbi:MAG: Serine acetyltransferase [Verrucomicrobiales bacterium]|nr:Serine acetyltransferase [Verrucomicrobiales bacterium]